ncbi:MAG TPA: hypothetical protein P5149_00645 [Candidatus Competibacteraceae bacterium]|mgnify:FL=1|nr:hypothetical protein [Candidatus Competibacteraceae bacterium]MCP5134548.1 hypothetical protein [Gammaproteobacteria bacterium]HPF59637.1 hypothetical protein [Candidatus Competibacteraceae bacterium]HRY16883.1 hypothetical protein [Candidatus Competibacteraceae bacterium]
MNKAQIAALLLVLAGNTLAAADEFALLRAEHIGPLRIDQPAAEAERQIPCPVQRSPAELWGADGEYHQTWAAPACGLTLDMSAAGSTGPWILAAITLTAPGTWSTGRGISLGATEQEVMTAYGQDRNTEESQAEQTFVAGSIYGGLLFTFEAGRVTQIFLGAAAE